MDDDGGRRPAVAPPPPSWVPPDRSFSVHLGVRRGNASRGGTSKVVFYAVFVQQGCSLDHISDTDSFIICDSLTRSSVSLGPCFRRSKFSEARRKIFYKRAQGLEKGSDLLFDSDTWEHAQE